MIIENYLKDIKKRLKEEIVIQDIEIIDNSQKHTKHKFFSKDKYHLHINVSSQYLKSLTRLQAQRIIFKILKEDLKNKIHALEISIY